MFATIIFPIPINRTYFYTVPDNLKRELKIGMRVKVDFNNRLAIGYVTDLKENIEDKTIIPNLKPVISIIDKEPIFTKNMFLLARWISEYYICSIGEALKVMLPSAVNEKQPELQKIKDKISQRIVLTPAQQQIYNDILKLPIPSSVLIYGVTGSGKTEIYFKLIEYFIKKKSRFYTLSLKFH